MKKILTILIFFTQLSYSLEFISKKVVPDPIKLTGHVSVGDLNGDGYNDIFVSEIYSIDTGGCPPGVLCSPPIVIDEPAKIFVNNQKGGYSQIESSIPTSQLSILNIPYFSKFKSYKTTIADMNNDGFNDVVASDGRIFINNGEADFTQVLVNIGSGMDSIYAVDFDNDGILEIFHEGVISRRTALSSLTYSKDNQTIINPSFEVKFADFNNDGFVDIISFGKDSFVTIYINNQAGGFSNDDKITLDMIENISLLAGDVNGDTKVDIVLSDYSILLNQGELSFEKIENQVIIDDVNQTYYPVDFVQLTETGLPGLLMRSDDSYNSQVLYNNGSGQFVASEIFSYDSRYGDDFQGHVIALDVDDDGIDDFIVPKISNGSYIVPFFSELIEREDGSYDSRSELDPFVAMDISIRITNPLAGDNQHINANYKYIPFDLNNDGQKEYLSIYSYNRYNLALESSTNFDYTSKYWGFRPHYLSNISIDGLKVNDLDLFNGKVINYQSFSSGDVNNDGKEDLLVTYKDCTSCGELKTRVFFSSELGINSNNFLDLEGSGLFDLQVIDFDDNGSNEIIQIFNQWPAHENSTKLKILELLDGSQTQLFEFDIGQFGSQFKFYDINNDGIQDIVFLDNNNKISSILGGHDYSALSVPITMVDNYSLFFLVVDYDLDGDLDIFTSNQSYFDDRLNRFDNDDGVFSTDGTLYLPEKIFLPSIKFSDYDRDGKSEIVAISDHFISFGVYQYVNSHTYIEFYKYMNLESYLTKFSLTGDFDNDNLLDFIYEGKTYFARNFSFYTGLHYDSSHNGHGFSLENVGDNQFFTVFYTYDKDGYPEWYTNLGVFGEPQQDYWNIKSEDTYSLVRTEYDYTNNIAVQNTSNSYKGYLSHDSCSETFGEININYEIGVNSYGLPLSKANWCSQPIVDYYLRPHENFSGLWWAGDNDSGWGWSISLVERDDATDMVLVLYYYDAEGNPRWLIGQQSGFVQGQELTIDMNMVKGYPRGAIPTDLTLLHAGTVNITLNQVSHSLSQAGRMSVNVTYPGPEGGSWVRNDIPIALFSSPRE